MSSLVSGVTRSLGESLGPPASLLVPEELLEERLAGLAPAPSMPQLPSLGQHSSKHQSASNTLKNIKEAPSYSR